MACRQEIARRERRAVIAGGSLGRAENAGFDAFIPLIDSGIAMYVWSQQKFFSLVIYTCKAFDPDHSTQYVENALQVVTELATKDF